MVKNLTKKQLILIIITAFLIFSIPLGTYLIKKQQTIKSRASQTVDCPASLHGQLVGESCISGVKVKKTVYKQENECRVFLEPVYEKCSNNPSPTPGVTPPFNQKYDLNKDGIINSFDIAIFLQIWRNPAHSRRGEVDYNSDGQINVFDYGYLLKDFRS